MKKKNLIFLAVSCMLFMTACAAQNNKNVVEVETTLENPFDLDETTKQGAQVMASYGYQITNMDCEKREIPYEGGEVKLDFCVDNTADACNVGMVIFVDGIAQNYTLDGIETNKIVTPVALEEKKKKEFQIQFEPIFGDSGTMHSVFFACMYEPEYKPENKESGYGNYHNILPMLPWELSFQNDKKVEGVSELYEVEPISEERKKEYMRKGSDGTVQNQLDSSLQYKIYQEGQEVEEYITADKGIADFQVEFLGGGTKTYRVSAYVNNQLVEAFNGMNYVDVTVEKDNSSIVKGMIDLKKFNVEENNSFYLFFVPLMDGDFSDEYLIEKTSSINIVG